MSKRYVPDETYLVCSDGMQMQQLKVTSQSTIKITGKLAATNEDRTGENFICAKMVVATAIIGAIVAGIIAAATVATGGVAGALIVGGIAAAGGAAGAGVGLSLSFMPCICALLTMPNDWTPIHTGVKFEGKFALIESSTISCVLGGQIMIFYSKEAAQEAVDLRRKKTIANVGLVIASAFVAGAAFQGIVTAFGTGAGILSKFGWSAFGNYLGGAAISGTGAYGADLILDKGKNLAYEQLGIKDDIDGYNTDITQYNFDNTTVAQEKNPTEEGLEQSIKPIDASGKGSAMSENNTVSENQTINRTDYARLDDIQEIGNTSSTQIGVDENAIQSNHTPTSMPNEYVVQNEDFGGRYQDGYIQQVDINEQFHMQDNSFSQGARQQALQGAKGTLMDGKGFLMGLLPDLYKLIVNPLIADELQDFLKAMQNEEAKARAGINVKTQNY